MMKSGFLSVFEHGFTKGKSCATNLLTAFETWTKWMDEGYGVDIIYLDYRKAFDSVNHVKLIEKLMLANVDPIVTKRIAAFLQGRKSQTGIFRFGTSIEQSAAGICVGSSSVFDIHK